MEETLHTLGIYWNKLIAQTICFAVVLFVLQRFAYKPVLQMLEKRRAKIAEGLAMAQKSKTELARAEAEKRKILTEANERAAQMIAEAQKIAAAESEKKLQETVAQAETIIKKAEQASRLEREKMLLEAKKEVARLVVETVRKVTGKVLTSEDHHRLNEETLQHLSA